MSMIEVENLTKYYGSFPAVRGVDLSVDRGEILGFLGPNGAGKTTTMRILTGSLNPTSGRATIAGHDVVSDGLAARRITGYLPENAPLYEDMRVCDYLRYCGRLRRMGGGHLRERIRQVVGTTALEPKFKAPISTLSKGYRQRVGIAQALLHEPEVIILDEPTVGLDPNQVVDVRRLIKEVGEDRTVILCSHILSEVEATCGRVVIINHGEIVANGAPSSLRRELSDKIWLEIKARGTADELKSALNNVQGLGDLRVTGESGGFSSVRAETAGSAELVGVAMTQALRDAGLEVASLQAETALLEDVFRELTKESA